jgi:hypothetical protein
MRLVPEVGVPSIDELVLSVVEGGRLTDTGFGPRGILRAGTHPFQQPIKTPQLFNSIYCLPVQTIGRTKQ